MYKINKNIGWQLVCSESQIQSKPLSFTIMNTKIVVFKDESKIPTVLEDRCIHRHVSLSKGRVENGCVVCPYHGAAFDRSGSCKSILSSPQQKNLPRRKVRKYQCKVDEYGYLWVNLAESFIKKETPFLYSKESSDKILKYEYIVKSPALSIIENFVDCAHTGVVHNGFFRGKPSKPVMVQVKSSKQSVVIETIGEKSSDSVLSKMFNPKNRPVIHIDEYIAPSTVKVTYSVGNIKVITVSVCTQINEYETRVHTFLSLSAPLIMRNVLLPALNYYTKIILKQDVEILEDQGSQLMMLDNPKSIFFDTDRAIIEVIRLYRYYLEGNEEQAFNGKEFKYQMVL